MRQTHFIVSEQPVFGVVDKRNRANKKNWLNRFFKNLGKITMTL